MRADRRACAVWTGSGIWYVMAGNRETESTSEIQWACGGRSRTPPGGHTPRGPRSVRALSFSSSRLPGERESGYFGWCVPRPTTTTVRIIIILITIVFIFRPSYLTLASRPLYAYIIIQTDDGDGATTPQRLLRRGLLYNRIRSMVIFASRSFG